MKKKYGGNLIFKGIDDYGVVEVVDTGNVRTLHFGSATVQSSMFVDNPYSLEMQYNQVMMSGLYFMNPKNVLFLGLGGGAKPKFLWKYFPEMSMDVVEISPLVIDISKRYFFVPEDARLRIFQEDALRFLHQDTTKTCYDMIFVDLYDDLGMASTVAEHDFFSLCDEKLNPGGVLIWNLWRSTSKQVMESSVTHLSHVFGREQLFLPNNESSNLAVIAFKKPLVSVTEQSLHKRAAELDALTGFAFPAMLQNLNFFQGHGFAYQNLL